MLKKKILGAKVLDTNGYVLATRLVTPVKQSGKYQLGDILNADAVDLIVSKAIEEHGVDVLKLQDNIKESVDNAKKEIVAGASEDYDTMKEVADYIIKHKGEYATLSTTVSNISTDVNNYKSATNESINTVKKDLTNEVSRAKTAEEANANNISTNATNLSNEITRAKAAEEANAASISSLSSGKVDKTTTVNGHALSGNVTVTKGDVGLGNCDNTSDANKPISTAAQKALDLKVDKTTTVNGHALSGNVTVTKSDLVIENVDNTSDINKPISKATQSALNLKADLASPALTGTPTAPTATEGTSTTQLATTAFVTSADNKKVDKTTTVNGHALSGNITITKGDVGLGSVDNTADSDKSVKHAASADNDGSGNNIVKTYATITNLTAETSRAKSAEETNASNLSNEITRAKAAESTLQTSVSKNKSAIDILNGTSDVEGSVKKAIKDVVGAAPEALDTLEEIAKQLESDESTVKALTNTISEETTRAKTAEEVNASSILVEVNRAKAAETANKEAISAVQSTVQGITINGSYNKDTNKLTINLVIPGVSNPATCQIDMADIIDQNDLVDSDTTTVERVDGKSKTNVNVMSDDDVLNLIDKIQ